MTMQARKCISCRAKLILYLEDFLSLKICSTGRSTQQKMVEAVNADTQRGRKGGVRIGDDFSVIYNIFSLKS